MRSNAGSQSSSAEMNGSRFFCQQARSIITICTCTNKGSSTHGSSCSQRRNASRSLPSSALVS
jgi:hypothetical protein